MQNLHRRHSGFWVARLAVPQRLRHVVWRSEFIQSTGSRDLAIAKLVASALITRWRLQLYEADRLLHSAPMDSSHETVLRIVEGSPAFAGDRHLPLEKAAAELGIEADELLRSASSGRLRLFYRFAGAGGHLLHEDEMDVDDPSISGSRVVPGKDQMPESAARDVISGVLPMPPRDSAAAAGALLERRVPTVVLFESERSKVAFIPDVAVQIERCTAEFSTVEIESLRRGMATEISADRIEAAKAFRMTLARGKHSGPGKGAQKRLSEALKAYKQHRLRADVSSEDEIKRISNGCALLVELEGDPLVGAIDAERLRLFRDKKLSLMPEHEGRVRLKFNTASVTSSIKAIAGTNWPVMSTSQRDLRMQWIRAWFRWLKAQGWIAEDPGAALAGESVLTKAEKRAVGRRDDESRLPFADDQLQRIFSAAWFASGRGATTSKGTYASFTPSWYWLPLLGVMTGARLNELAQLHVGDVRQNDGEGWFIDINDDAPDKRLKNSPSRRIVPLHPYLLTLGFDKWHSALKAEGYTRLFPELLYDEGKGYSKAAVKQFSSFMAKLGYARDGRLTFHSFRHTVSNALPERTPDRIRRQILGHERGSDVHDKTYRKDAQPSTVLQFLRDLNVSLPRVAPFDAEEGLKALRDALKRKVGRKG